MNQQSDLDVKDSIEIESLKNIAVRKSENGFVVALIDNEGVEMVRGYGETPSKALNDLHGNLI